MTDGRTFMVRGLHLTALSFFALALADPRPARAQPRVLRRPRLAGADIVVLALGLTLVPPLVLLGIEGLAHLASPRLSRAASSSSGSWPAFALLVLGWIGAPSAAHLAALAAGAVAAFAYARFEPVRAVVTLPSHSPFRSFSGSSSSARRAAARRLERRGARRGRRGEAARAGRDGRLRRSLVMSLLDPSGIDAARFPAFAAFARESTWYRNTVTVDANTSHAVPRAPDRAERGGAAILSNHPQNLFRFSAARTGSRRPRRSRLCPDDLCPRGDPEGPSARGSTP